MVGCDVISGLGTGASLCGDLGGGLGGSWRLGAGGVYSFYWLCVYTVWLIGAFGGWRSINVALHWIIMTFLCASHLRKTYQLGRVQVSVLRGVSLDVKEGEWLAILGASGSGKSTLLHLLGALDRPDDRESTIRFDQQVVTEFGEAERNQYRNRSVGFVFQFYHLLPEFNIIENVAVSAMVRYGRFGFSKHKKEVYGKAEELLTAFGMKDRLKHRPNELSGGERQRVAIARSLINDPPLLLADEPTGNLDQATGSQILDVIGNLHRERGQTMVMVTHDSAVAKRADRIVRLRNGLIHEE